MKHIRLTLVLFALLGCGKDDNKDNLATDKLDSLRKVNDSLRTAIEQAKATSMQTISNSEPSLSVVEETPKRTKESITEEVYKQWKVFRRNESSNKGKKVTWTLHSDFIDPYGNIRSLLKYEGTSSCEVIVKGYDGRYSYESTAKLDKMPTVHDGDVITVTGIFHGLETETVGSGAVVLQATKVINHGFENWAME